MKRVDRVFLFKVLTPLAVIVLLGHLLLLQGAVLTVGRAFTPPGRSFTMRAIESPARPVQASRKAATAKAPTRIRQQAAPSEPAPVQGPAPAVAQIVFAEPPSLAAQEERSPHPPDPALNQEQEVREPADELALAPRALREQIASASHYAIPRAATLKFQVTSNKFPFSLNAELEWQQDGETYDARLAFGAFGLSRVQTSRGQITAEGLAPLRFSDKYRSEVAAHFVREKGKVIFSANTPELPLLAGAQDRLSIVVQLAAMMAGDPTRFPPASTIALQIVGPRAADIWLFTVENDETLDLPGGQQPTRKLVRNPRQQYDQRVELWLAPALGYLPARIRITESNGDFVDQKWRASEPPT